MDERNYQNSYENGSTKPPKSHGGIIAVVLCTVIFLCGIVSILTMLNIRIFQEMAAKIPQETAAIDFKYTLDHCRENSLNKAYHLIQAFAPGEVSFEEAHRIGKELADRLLQGKYSYVVTTHIDKGHVHNHIIFCAADNINIILIISL